MTKLDEETRTNGYIVKERLPKDLQQRRKMIQNLQKVVSVPAMGQSDLEELRKQVSTWMRVSVCFLWQSFWIMSLCGVLLY